MSFTEYTTNPALQSNRNLSYHYFENKALIVNYVLFTPFLPKSTPCNCLHIKFTVKGVGLSEPDYMIYYIYFKILHGGQLVYVNLQLKVYKK